MKADMCFVEYVGGEKFEKEIPKCSRKLEEFRRRSQPKSHEAKKLPLAILHMTCFGMMLNVTLKNLCLFIQVNFLSGFDPMEFITILQKQFGNEYVFPFVPTHFFMQNQSHGSKVLMAFCIHFHPTALSSQRVGLLNPPHISEP